MLIDKASAIAGNDAALSRMLGVSRQTISNWRHGHKPCPPADQALLAAVAGADPLAELARATLRQHEGTKKGDLLMRALGKALLATGGAVASAGAHASLIFGTPQATEAVRAVLSTMYRKVERRRMQRPVLFNRRAFC